MAHAQGGADNADPAGGRRGDVECFEWCELFIGGEESVHVGRMVGHGEAFWLRDGFVS